MEDLFVEKPSRFVFESCQNRKTFPQPAATKFGVEQQPIRGTPITGPGAYNNEEVSNLIYCLNDHIVSRKGYSLGARTAPRFGPTLQLKTPGPDEYQGYWSNSQTFKEEYKPFQSGAERFPTFKRERQVLPGPGAYEHNVSNNRKVGWKQTFGSSPSNLPHAAVQSTLVANTDKLNTTVEEKKYNRRLAYLSLYY